MQWPANLTVSSLSHYYRILLRSCARQTCLSIGEKLHSLILTTGLSTFPHNYIRNALLHMYSSCGHLFYAQKLFEEIPLQEKDAVDYTTLMGCLVRGRKPNETLNLFVGMLRFGWRRPDDLTMICFFNASAQLADARIGIQGRGFVVKMGFEFSVKASNAAMDMYVKSGMLSEARRMFEKMNERTVVSWTVILDGIVRWEGVRNGRDLFNLMPDKNEVAWTIMIVGYIEEGFLKEGFDLVCEMAFSMGFELNHVTVCSILSACSQSGSLVIGRWVHGYVLKRMGEEMNLMIATALVDMYGKCGRMNSAVGVFLRMRERNVVAWNAMLSVLAMHGHGKAVVDMFLQMTEEVKPDDVSLTCVLNGCSHSGLVDQGWHYFCNLESGYGIKPKIEHYACMVDLLGRAGRLEDAEMLMRKMSMSPNEVILGSLLGSCHVHGKLQLGEHLVQEVVQMDPHNTEYHILLSNMYALAGHWNKANSLRQVLKEKNIRKVPGMSSIHIDGCIHRFSAGDKSHPRTKEIYKNLDQMICKLRSSGYVPNASFQVFSGSEKGENTNEQEEREQSLFYHSEKLAVCFGLMSTKKGVPLYIFKNLRICQDCHAAIKIASKIYEREIIVRDRNRFHSFEQGSCSCSDYW